MKKPKTELEKAKERFIDNWRPWGWAAGSDVRRNYMRQLNNLIRLAKEEGRQGK